MRRGDDELESAAGGAARRGAVRPFLLWRFTLIVATACLLCVEGSFTLPPFVTMLLLAGALASNVVVAQLPDRVTGRTAVALGIIIADTVWVSIALVQNGRFSAEFFHLYFFVLLLVAIVDNLYLIVVGALASSFAYVYVLSAMGGNWSMWSSPSLLRIPFLFVAVFSGYWLDRARHERRHADAATEELCPEVAVSAVLVRSDAS